MSPPFTPRANASPQSSKMAMWRTGQRAPSPARPALTDADGALTVSVRPYGYIVYKADAAVPASTAAPDIAFNTPSRGQQFDLNVSN
ncbi:MAG: hypothetical protein R2911_12615 [Caldilineaceae bacterium]